MSPRPSSRPPLPATRGTIETDGGLPAPFPRRGRGARGGDPLAGPPRPQPWIRQGLACLLVFLLSTRLPGHLVALIEAWPHPGPDGPHAPGAALLMVALDGFGILCSLYLGHTRLAGVRLWTCYPPQRLIPLSLHFLGLLWGLLSLAAGGGSGGG